MALQLTNDQRIHIYNVVYSRFPSRAIAHYGMCIRIIDVIAGADWIPAFIGSQADPHVAWGESGPSRIAQFRVCELARNLFLLQEVPGFDDMVAKLRTRSLLGASAELHTATLLHQNGHRTRFVSPTGVRGQDYDLSTSFGGVDVAVEVKAKDEATTLSRNTLRYTLAEARKQLPTDRAGVVAVAIPAAWTTQPDIAVVIDGEIERLFRTSGRIGGVVILWNELLDDQAGGAGFAVTTRLRTYENENARSKPQIELADLFNTSIVEQYASDDPWSS